MFRKNIGIGWITLRSRPACRVADDRRDVVAAARAAPSTGFRAPRPAADTITA
jgi:hypothetical protein